ncbi:MAG: hypothetical protein AAGH90_07020 [Pseudomonadota bacterium]
MRQTLFLTSGSPGCLRGLFCGGCIGFDKFAAPFIFRYARPLCAGILSARLGRVAPTFAITVIEKLTIFARHFACPLSLLTEPYVEQEYTKIKKKFNKNNVLKIILSYTEYANHVQFYCKSFALKLQISCVDFFRKNRLFLKMLRFWMCRF